MVKSFTRIKKAELDTQARAIAATLTFTSNTVASTTALNAAAITIDDDGSDVGSDVDEEGREQQWLYQFAGRGVT